MKRVTPAAASSDDASGEEAKRPRTSWPRGSSPPAGAAGPSKQQAAAPRQQAAALAPPQQPQQQQQQQQRQQQAPGRAPAGPPTRLRDGSWTELGDGARVGYWPRMLVGPSQRLMRTLLTEVPWQQRDLFIFGRAVAQPRLVAYMCDAGLPEYSYSGATMDPLPWSEAVLEIKAAVETLLGATFNSCLLNLYQSGDHYVSWHADNESLYGPAPTIASVSLGEPREFHLRRNADHSHTIKLTLSAGDVLAMAGTTQDHWQHTVPKRKKVTQPRINLTFRSIVMSGRGGKTRLPHKASAGRQLG